MHTLLEIFDDGRCREIVGTLRLIGEYMVRVDAGRNAAAYLLFDATGRLVREWS